MDQNQITDTEVKTFISQLEQSFNNKDINAFGSGLSEQLKVVLQLSPTNKPTLNRESYLNLLQEDSPKRTAKYDITAINTEGAVTIVEGTSTETNGQETIIGKWRMNLAKQGNKILITQIELCQ